METEDFFLENQINERDKDKRKDKIERLNEAYSKRGTDTLPKYLRTRSGEYSGVLETPRLLQCLPNGEGFQVLGMYNPMNHSIEYAINLPIAEREHVIRHEIVHSYGFIDETQTDHIASMPDYEAYAA